jgi:hypothetical protein
VIDVPPSLARHFRGRPDVLTLLRAPDETLFALACEMTSAERHDLYDQLFHLRLGFAEQFLARAAGMNPDAERRRFLSILQIAEERAAAELTFSAR